MRNRPLQDNLRPGDGIGSFSAGKYTNLVNQVRDIRSAIQRNTLPVIHPNTYQPRYLQWARVIGYTADKRRFTAQLLDSDWNRLKDVHGAYLAAVEVSAWKYPDADIDLKWFVPWIATTGSDRNSLIPIELVTFPNGSGGWEDAKWYLAFPLIATCEDALATGTNPPPEPGDEPDGKAQEAPPPGPTQDPSAPPPDGGVEPTSGGIHPSALPIGFDAARPYDRPAPCVGCGRKNG